MADSSESLVVKLIETATQLGFERKNHHGDTIPSDKIAGQSAVSNGEIEKTYSDLLKNFKEQIIEAHPGSEDEKKGYSVLASKLFSKAMLSGAKAREQNSDVKIEHIFTEDERQTLKDLMADLEPNSKGSELFKEGEAFSKIPDGETRGPKITFNDKTLTPDAEPKKPEQTHDVFHIVELAVQAGFAEGRRTTGSDKIESLPEIKTKQKEYKKLIDTIRASSPDDAREISDLAKAASSKAETAGEEGNNIILMNIFDQDQLDKIRALEAKINPDGAPSKFGQFSVGEASTKPEENQEPTVITTAEDAGKKNDASLGIIDKIKGMITQTLKAIGLINKEGELKKGPAAIAAIGTIAAAAGGFTALVRNQRNNNNEQARNR